MIEHFGPSALLECYRQGIFPMSDSRDDTEVFFMEPELRGVIPLDGLHISRSLQKFMRQSNWVLRYNKNFPAVIKACAKPDKGRENTWISKDLETLYLNLHENGFAYSVEVYEGETLIGGLYGVTQGSAFFGESMFSKRKNASKVALVGLVGGLNKNDFKLLDTQFSTPHLASLGCVEIKRETYQTRLKNALKTDKNFPTGSITVADLMQSNR